MAAGKVEGTWERKIEDLVRIDEIRKMLVDQNMTKVRQKRSEKWKSIL